MSKILVTGTAGFIGFHLAKSLLERGDEVIGLDCINDYYDIGLKYSRLEYAGILKGEIKDGELVQSTKFNNYRFIKLKLEDRESMLSLFKDERFDIVCNLAGQAGVRYSIQNPFSYIDSNIVGFINVLEGCKQNKVKHLVYASSSSVYGLNESMPFSPGQNVDHPISLYAASKKSNELMAHSYSYLYGLPTTGLRFFTVYGPWGRPDMAIFIFTKAINEGNPVNVYNNGKMKRDFTYVDDIVDGLLKIVDKIPVPNSDWSGKFPDPSSSVAPYRIYNIGNSAPVNLLDFIEVIEESLGRKAIIKYLPLQNGDVIATWADIEDLEKTFNFKPKVSVKDGVRKFIDWYLSFYDSKEKGI